MTDLKSARNAEDLAAYQEHTKEVVAVAESNRYHYIKVNKEQADQLRGAGIAFEGDTAKNEVSVIRILPAQSAKAEQLLKSNSIKNGIKK